jgi:glucan phosphoethanolaminetransferase (alkaline phosphatase superfamily)
MSHDSTRIPVQKETREKLKSRGKKGETYDEIINKLLENVDNKTEDSEVDQ